jgi:hypothetical protein
VELSDHLVNSYGSSPRSGDFLSFSGEYMRCNVAEGSVSSTAETVVASPASQQSHRQAFSSRNSQLGAYVAVVLTEMPFAPSAPSLFNTYIIYHVRTRCLFQHAFGPNRPNSRSATPKGPTRQPSLTSSDWADMSLPASPSMPHAGRFHRAAPETDCMFELDL